MLYHEPAKTVSLAKRLQPGIGPAGSLKVRRDSRSRGLASALSLKLFASLRRLSLLGSTQFRLYGAEFSEGFFEVFDDFSSENGRLGKVGRVS